MSKKNTEVNERNEKKKRVKNQDLIKFLTIRLMNTADIYVKLITSR